MVYRGKPSAGCEQCRKAKKRCGLERPSCARCEKLKKPCSGYRDTTALQIQDESESVRQKVNRYRSGHTPPGQTVFVVESPTRIVNGIATPKTNGGHTPFSEASAYSDETTEIVPDGYGHSTVLQNSQDDNNSWPDRSAENLITSYLKPSPDDVATTYFFNHFTTNQGHWDHLRQLVWNSNMDPILDFAIRACGMAALHNVQKVNMGREYSAMFYGQALGLLNSALRDSKRSKTDDSLLAVFMLGYYENLTCDSRQSIQSWKAHISGATQLIKIRGTKQFKSQVGRGLYREIRPQILTQCMWDNTDPPAFLDEFEAELDEYTLCADPSAPSDKFMRLCYRFQSIRARLRLETIADKAAMEELTEIERDLVQWSIDTINGHPLWRYHEVEAPEGPHVWKGLVHSYSYHWCASTWNTYRSMRTMITRVQENVYRTVNSNIAPDDAQIAYFRNVRQLMTDEICLGVPTQLGHAAPAPNSPVVLITAYSSVWPLFFAGTSALERVGQLYFAVGVKEDTSAAVAQTAWIISRMDYITKEVGLKWADGIAGLLKGNFDMHGDILLQEDQDYIRYYWRERAKRQGNPEEVGSTSAPAWLQRIQASVGRLQEPLKDNNISVEPGKYAPDWVQRIQRQKTPRFPQIVSGQESKQMETARAETAWWGGVLGGSNGNFVTQTGNRV